MLSPFTLETQRQAAAIRYHELQFDKEKSLQDIVKIASYIFNAPIAMVTLVGEELQWIINAKGFEGKEMPRETSFCTHAIQSNDIMVVEDALQDERFVSVPAVTGSLNIRFYAGISLKSTDGYNVGTLCVYDTKPVKPTEEQLACLQGLNRQVEMIMASKEQASLLKNAYNTLTTQHKQLKESETKLKAIYESFEGFHFLLDTHLSIVSYNQTVANYFQNDLNWPVKEGDNVLGFIQVLGLSHLLPIIKKAIQGEVIITEEKIIQLGINPIWIRFNFSPAKDEEGNIIGVSVNAINISLRKEREEEVAHQNSLLKEIAQIQSHEFRGPLSSLMGLINLARYEQGIHMDEYLPLMDKAAQELDKRIHQSVRLSSKLRA